jgi:site-specific DNA-adenine methylase
MNSDTKKQLIEFIDNIEKDYDELATLIQELIKKHDERKLSMDPGDSEIVEKLRKMVSDT